MRKWLGGTGTVAYIKASIHYTAQVSKLRRLVFGDETMTIVVAIRHCWDFKICTSLKRRRMFLMGSVALGLGNYTN